MVPYDEIVKRIEEKGIIVADNLPLPKDINGMFIHTSKGMAILLSKNITNTNEKRCVIAEEIGHYATTHGDITDQTIISNRKLEKVARNWGYERLVSIDLLIEAFEKRVQGKYDLAEFLGVTISFLEKAIEHYDIKHGGYLKHGVYAIYFSPLGIMKDIE